MKKYNLILNGLAFSVLPPRSAGSTPTPISADSMEEGNKLYSALQSEQNEYKDLLKRQSRTPGDHRNYGKQKEIEQPEDAAFYHAQREVKQLEDTVFFSTYSCFV